MGSGWFNLVFNIVRGARFWALNGKSAIMDFCVGYCGFWMWRAEANLLVVKQIFEMIFFYDAVL